MKTNREKKAEYLDEHVFYGLTNLNTGFDASSIKYFSEEDFGIVLDRVQHLGLGIYGVEPWQDGSYFDVITWEEWRDWGIQSCRDPRWYRGAFQAFICTEKDLQYSASYEIPWLINP